jgi:NAD(P)-dependent dehydrogenase (short-subunit alcohol dehydrogenase family)
MAPLANKKVVVIGGTSGVGFAVAKAVLAEGGQVSIGSSNAEKLAGALTRLGKGATGNVIDVRKEDSVEAFFKEIGEFDHLVFTVREPLVVRWIDVDFGLLRILGR